MTESQPEASNPPSIDALRQEIDQLRAELRDAQQMSALGELVSTTTHEFNNVLTTILNYAKLGLRHTDEATRTRSLEKILSAGQRAEKLTSSVLGLARNRSTDPAPTDLAALVEETLVLLERELQKHRVRVERRFEARGKAMVVGNQIQQVLLNLLTNARQAMSGGGMVTIAVADDPAAGTVDLSVRDTAPAWRPRCSTACSSAASPRRRAPTRPARAAPASASQPAARSSRRTAARSASRAPWAAARSSR